MSTILQKELAKNIVKNAKSNRRKNKKELLVSTGYAVSTAESEPNIIFESKGVQEELENLGFDEESAKKVIKRILVSGKEENQIKAAQEIFKVSGSYAPERHLNVNIPIPLDALPENNSVPEDKEAE